MNEEAVKMIEKLIDELAKMFEGNDDGYLEALSEMTDRSANAFNAHQEFLEEQG